MKNVTSEKKARGQTATKKSSFLSKKGAAIITGLCFALIICTPLSANALDRYVDTDIISDNIDYIADYINTYGYINDGGNKVISYDPTADTQCVVILYDNYLKFGLRLEEEKESHTFVYMYIDFPYSEVAQADISIYMKDQNDNVVDYVEASGHVDPSDYIPNIEAIPFTADYTNLSDSLVRNWCNWSFDYALGYWDEMLSKKMDMSVIQLGFSNLCNHSWDNGTKIATETCTNNGEMKYTCEWCGLQEFESIPATGHSWDNGVITIPATCTASGVKTFTCSNCNQNKTEAIPAEGHNYGGWTITKEASYTTEGSMIAICSKCGNKITETIPALEKKTNTLTVKAITKTVKYKKLKKTAQTVKAITVKSAKGTVSYKVVGGKAKAKKALKLNTKNGKITVKKKTKRGTYKIKVKVTAKGNTEYKAKSKSVWVKIQVK